MAVVSAEHRSAQHYCSVATQTDDFGPAATYAATASPAATCAATAASPVMEYVDQHPLSPILHAVTFDAHGQQLPPAYTSTTDITDDTFDITDLVHTQFSSTAVETFAEPFSPHVVGPLPPLKEFPEPVYNQIHQEQIATGETTENITEINIEQEQVIIQEIPEVVVSLPPVEEFTAPVYKQVHQEQLITEEMTHNIVENRTMQDQVIVQDIPEVVERIQEPPVFVTAPMTETAPVVAEDVLSVQGGDIISDNFTDEEFAQALVPLDTAISQHLGNLKSMNDRVSSLERTLEEARCKLDSQRCTKSQRRQLENDLASASNMMQCERDKVTEVKCTLSSALRQRQCLLALRSKRRRLTE